MNQPEELSFTIEGAKNFNLVEEDKYNHEYTFEKDGKNYKVVGKIGEDYKSSTSDIYVKSSEGVYELYQTEKAVLGDDGELTVENSGQEANYTEHFDFQLDTEVEPELETPTTSSLNQSSDMNARAAGVPISGWEYQRTQYHNSQIAKFTLGTITILVTGAIPLTLGASAGAAIYISGSISSIANLYYQTFAKNIFTRTQIYFKYEVFSPTLKIHFGEHNLTYFYKDSSYTQQVDQPVVYDYYRDGYGPNGKK